MDAGADPAELYDRIEQRERPQKLGADGAGRCTTSAPCPAAAGASGVVMALSREDFVQTGARAEDTQRLIDLPQQVAGVEVAAVVSERGSPLQPITSMSFRTKPRRADGSAPIDAAKLAGEFGGGGHARAAGAKVHAPLSEVLPRVIDAVERAVGDDTQGDAETHRV